MNDATRKTDLYTYEALLETRRQLFAERYILRAALQATLIPLIRLGDFIGNEDHGGASGLGPFDRCAIIRQVKDALEQDPLPKRRDAK